MPPMLSPRTRYGPAQMLEIKLLIRTLAMTWQTLGKNLSASHALSTSPVTCHNVTCRSVIVSYDTVYCSDYDRHSRVKESCYLRKLTPGTADRYLATSFCACCQTQLAACMLSSVAATLAPFALASLYWLQIPGNFKPDES